MRPPAVILGLTATGLGVSRSLARLGVVVHGVYSDPVGEYARHSRSLRARYRISDPTSHRELLRVLEHIRVRVGASTRPIVIATNDTYARFMEAHRETLLEAYVFHTAPNALVEELLDKRRLIDVCRRHAMPIPRSCAPDDLDDLQEAAEHFRYPVIVKPSSHDDKGFRGKNVVIKTSSDLLAFFSSRPDLIQRTMFQEMIPGGDARNVTVTAYSDIHGSVVALWSGRKLRQWIPDVGFNCFGVSETLPAVQQLARTFLDAIGFVGFARLEFVEDPVSGESYFLEINPRTVYDNQLCADAGVDISAIGYLEMCGEPPSRIGVQRDGVYWIDIHRDILSFVVKWLRREVSLAGWLRSVRQASSFACYDRHDLKPFLASILRLLLHGPGMVPGRRWHGLLR